MGQCLTYYKRKVQLMGSNMESEFENQLGHSMGQYLTYYMRKFPLMGSRMES